MDDFLLKFSKCRKKVAEAFLGLNLGSIINIEPKEGEREGEGDEATKGK